MNGGPVLDEWWPSYGADRSARLSRRVSVHNACPEQMTRANALTALMLVTGMSVALNYPLGLMRQSTPEGDGSVGGDVPTP